MDKKMTEQIESPQETWAKWRKWFWTKILWLAYRHLIDKGICPVGVPGVRDIEFRCDAFDPRPARFDPHPTCETDGHYLCEKCCHKVRLPEVYEVTTESLRLGI